MVMKLNIPSIGVLATIIVLASVGAIYVNTYDSSLSAEKTNIPPGSALMLSNVKVTHLNEFGEVIGYRQGTNHITATGMAVIMGQVFSGVNGTFPDPANVTGRVKWMEIGTAGENTYANALAWNNTNIVSPVGSPCIRVHATIDNSTQGPAHKAPSTCDPRSNCNARHNVTAVAQFQGAQCAAASIDEAGIFTSSSTDQNGLMFARNTFGSVTLGALDTLQLEWEFTFTDN